MGKALSPHLGTEFWFRRWPWWYFYISRLCFANWNADMCRNSLIVILCFCNIILGLADLFFFSFFHCQHCFSSELYYPLTSEEAKLHMSAWQESSTDSKFVTSCVFLLFPPWVMKYPLFRERYREVSLDGNHALSNGAAVASVLEGRNWWSSSKSFPMSSGNISPALIACIYG